MLYLQLLAGLVLLFLGGEALVRGAVAVARRLRVSELVIGLILVGFGTSTPELMTSIDAALAGAPGLALGNVIGSNVANVLLIMGVAAVITPMRTSRAAFMRDGSVLLGSTILLVAACMFDVIGRLVGLAFLGLLLAYVGFTYLSERRQEVTGQIYAAEADLMASPAVPGLGAALLITLLGLIGVLVGAKVLVGAAIQIARIWQVSEAVIGLSVVAIGTSLPELATIVVAAWRRQADVAFGNIVGSNIFNTLGILGTTALVRPLDVPAQVADFDVWVMLGVTLFLVGFAITGWRVIRAEGLALLFAYVAYIVVMYA